MKPMLKTFYLILLLLASSSLLAETKESQQTLKAMINKIKEQFKDVPHLTVKEAKALKSPIILDARNPNEINVSNIPGSSKILSAKELDMKRPILVYCTIGYRSSIQTQKLIKKGFKAHNLEGGILAWAHAGGNLIDAQGEKTKKVHTYGSMWNLLPDGYQGVY